MQRISLTLLILFCYTHTFAATKNTSNTGLWNTAGNWSGGVPGGADDANVNHALTINTNIATTKGDYIINAPIIDQPGGTAYNLNLSGTGGDKGNFDVNARATFEGTLTVSNHGILTIRSGDTLTVGVTTFANGSIVNIEAGGVLIINGNLTNNNNSNEIYVDGLIIVNGNVTGGNGSSIFGSGGISSTGYIDLSGSGSVFGSTSDCIPGPCGSGGGVLPIQLLSFDARLSEDHVTLNWVTLAEINNDFFTIERAGADLHFEAIIQLKGAGNSRSELHYQTTDALPLPGTSYYRLKQTDFNGAFSYSSEVAIENGKVKQSFTCYPNPTSGSVMVRDAFGKAYQGQVKVVNAQGRVVYETNVNNASSLELSELPSGVFTLVFTDLRGAVLGYSRVVLE